MQSSHTGFLDSVFGPSFAMIPLREVLCLHNAIFGFSVARTLPALVRFYAWFSSSGLEMAEKRGFGQSASKAWGIIPAPKLSVQATAASGIGLLLCLAAPFVPVMPDAFCPLSCVGALIFYHLYFSQVYCEAHVGAHVTVLTPPVLILLALAPAWQVIVDSNFDTQGATYFTYRMLQIILTSAYCGAGVSKIVSSIKKRRSWWDGATMQAIVLEAFYMSGPRGHFTFGLPTPFSHAIQRFCIPYPRLILAPASVLAVVFEAAAPVMLFFASGMPARVFAATGIGFHYGVAVLQNVDFVSWWSAAYAPFILAPESMPSWISIMQDAFIVAPICTALSCMYVAAHVTAIVVLRFFPHIEMLPFSCFHMFSALVDLFDASSRKWVWITDKPHATGTLKNYAVVPFARPQHVRADEFKKLPFKHVLAGFGGGDDVLLTNVDMAGAPRLAEAIATLREELCPGLSGAPVKAWSSLSVGLPKHCQEGLLGKGGDIDRVLCAIDEARLGLKEAQRNKLGKVGVEDSSDLSQNEQLIGA